MNNSNLGLLILLEAKTEYTEQLINILSPRIVEGLESLYRQSIKILNKNTQKVLITFQTMLSNIPKWDANTIDIEYQRIIKKSECEWLDKLIQAVFICFTKILTVIQVSDKIEKPIDLEVPKAPYFIHQCYIEIARGLWNNPYLIYDIDLPSYEKQRNQNLLNELIKEKITNTVRKLLPVKTILMEALGESYIPDNEKTLENIPHLDNIRLLAKKDIESIRKKGDELTLELKTPPSKVDTVVIDNREDTKEDNREDTKEDNREDTKEDNREDTKEDSKNETTKLDNKENDFRKFIPLNLSHNNNEKTPSDESVIFSHLTKLNLPIEKSN